MDDELKARTTRLRPDQVDALEVARAVDGIDDAKYIRQLLDEHLPKRMRRLKIK